MVKVEVHIGEDRAAMGRRFIDAWHRAQRGEEVNERHLSFDSEATADAVRARRQRSPA